MTLETAIQMNHSIMRWMLFHDTNTGNPEKINYSLSDMLRMAVVLESENKKYFKRKSNNGKPPLYLIPNDIQLAAMYVAMNVLGEDPKQNTHSIAVCNGNYILVIRPSQETLAEQKEQADSNQLNLLDQIEEVSGEGKVISMNPETPASHE